MIRAAAPIRLPSILFLLLSWGSLSASGMYPSFTPPSRFIPATTPDSSKIKTAFLHKDKKGFTPSINLAEERFSSSIEEYLAAVQQLYTSNSRNRWRKWGTLKTAGGIAHLTSLDLELPAGNVRILQSFLLREGTVYILTASVLAEEFGTYQKEFIDSFRTLNITVSREEDLLSPEKNPDFQKPQ